MPKRITALAAGAALGILVAACGSSRAPGVVPAPATGATAASVPSTTPTTPTTTTPTTTVSTPTSGPLSTKPVVKAPKGAPPTHLVIKDLIKGNGATAQDGKTITVNYVGVLYKNGTEFDSSWQRHQTFTTPLSNGSVITGWVKGIAGMKVGGRRELIIPPGEAYGKSGSGSIPPNSTLIFVVDLLSVS